MKTPFIKFILRFSCCVAAVIMPPVVTWCCGPVLMADESRFALFRQGLDNNSGLKPFHYSEGLFNFTETDPEQLDYKRNCREWVSFCGRNVTPEDVYEVQYKISPAAFIEIFKYARPQIKTKNTFINWLSEKSNIAALDYMQLAKQAEETQFNYNTDPWDTTVQQITVYRDQVALKAVNALSLQLPVFLKERYAFQAIKMCYYSGNEKSIDETIERIYKNYLADSKSIVAGWSLVYVGMRTNDLNQRTTILLQAFDKTEEKKEFCYLKISNNDLSRLEKRTTENNLLALIKTMAAVKNKGKALTQLTAVYKCNPNSKYIPLLITREINKLENWLWSPEMLYFYENSRPETPEDETVTTALLRKLKTNDKQYLLELRTFIESIAYKNKTHPIFLQLALAHLYNMQGDFTKANESLQSLGRLTNVAQETQRLIEQVIVTAHLRDISNATTQQNLANYINALTRLNPVFKKQLTVPTDSFWETGYRNKNDACLSELFILLSHCFEKKGNTAMAVLLYNKSNLTINRYDGWNGDNMFYRHIAYLDRSAGPADIDSLLLFKHKKSKTPFEQMISPKVWGTDDQYKDLKGTILFRQRKYNEALTVFKSMDPNFWHTCGEYKDNLPLTSVLHTGGMIPSENTIPSTYRTESKFLIVKDILGIQNKISLVKTNEEKAVLYYQLANAYFNTSYNGKAWMMFSYGKSSREMYSGGEGNYSWAFFNFYPNNLKYADYYYCCSDAIATYKKALSLTTNKEFAAKCLLALSACDIIRYNYLQNTGKTHWTSGKRYIPDYLRKLKARYSDTDAFAEAAIECPDVKNL